MAMPLAAVQPLRILRSLPPTVQVLVAGTFVNKLGTLIIPYLTLVLRREFDLDERRIGLLMLAYGLGSLTSILTGGWLTDRLGRRVTLLLSLTGSGAVAVTLGLVSTIAVFAPLLVLLGFLADLYRPASSSIIADLLPSERRATGFAALRMAVNLGFSVGMMLGGFLADWSWRVLFLGDGLTTLAFATVVWRFIPETRQAHAGWAESAAPSPWRDVVFLQMLLLSFGWCLVFFSHMTELPLTITLGAGYAPWLYGVLVGLNGLLIGLFEVTVVERLRPYRRLKVAAVGTLVVGLGFASVAVARHWTWFLVVVLAYTAGEILASPQKMAFVSDWAPPEARGRYLAWYQATWSLAMALNPILFLPLQARLGDSLFWPLTFLIVAPCAALLWRLDGTADRPELLRGSTRAAAADGAALAAEPETGG
jgi:MFS family permease